jgi:hypothetical protein
LLHLLSPSLSFSLLAKLWYALFSYWTPGHHPILTSFTIGLAEVLPALTGSFISNWFLTCGLLVALIMEAGRTSETLVN